VETLCLILNFLSVVMTLDQKQVCRIITIDQVRLTQVMAQQIVLIHDRYYIYSSRPIDVTILISVFNLFLMWAKNVHVCY